MNRRTVIGMLTVLCLVCSISHAAAGDKTPEQMLKEAKSAIKEVTVGDVKKMLDTKENVIILDVRDKNELEDGYIPGAMNISRGMLEFKSVTMLTDKNAKIIVYCALDLRAPLATRTLNELGYRNAVSMTGGIRAWKTAGYPLTK